MSRCQHEDIKTNYDEYSNMGPSITRTKCKADVKYLDKDRQLLVCIEHAPVLGTLIDLRDLNNKPVG